MASVRAGDYWRALQHWQHQSVVPPADPEVDLSHGRRRWRSVSARRCHVISKLRSWAPAASDAFGLVNVTHARDTPSTGPSTLCFAPVMFTVGGALEVSAPACSAQSRSATVRGEFVSMVACSGVGGAVRFETHFAADGNGSGPAEYQTA